MRASGPIAVSALLATVAGATACQPMEPSCAAALTSPGVPFLSSEVDRALKALREARDTLPPGGVDSGESLDRAEDALLRLQGYYLPLLEARLRASNAHQLAASGDLGRAEDELARIEETLLSLARTGGPEMGREVRSPLDLLEEARVALTESSPESPARIQTLAERLELLLLKGDLVLK
ncbi:MAG: hypothetical protein LJF30_10135 [Acidobacteria bacterium]|jgi:hypothetical protein|nr:hypothetical protein [Acidobacteriota bacterium]